uniref:Uncharacterized protein n=1 Tax=Oryza glumipatula TaxID=40148 RepID=A0A0D9YAY8_9ORYZ
MAEEGHHGQVATYILYQLHLRAHTIIEEVDGRYASNQTNQGMLWQLKNVVYEGHHVLDTFRQHPEERKTFNLNKIHQTIESL